MTSPRVTHDDATRVAALARLELNNGNVSRTSRELNIPRTTLRLWRDHIFPDTPTLPVVASLGDRAPEIAARVTQEIEYLAFGNLSDVVSWTDDGHLSLTASADLTQAQAALISSIKVKRSRQDKGTRRAPEPWVIEDIEIKTRDKLKALEVRGRMLGMLVDRREVSGPDGGPIQHDIRAIVALRDELKQLREGA